MLSAAHCASSGTDSVDYVRLGEWEVIDPDQYKRSPYCFYYNKVSKQKCENSRDCRRDCQKEMDNIDCSNGRCAHEHQVKFSLINSLVVALVSSSSDI